MQHAVYEQAKFSERNYNAKVVEPSTAESLVTHQFSQLIIFTLSFIAITPYKKSSVKSS